MPIHIESIADHPDLVPLVARWHFDEWAGFDPADTLETWTAGLQKRTHRDRIPTVFLAFDAAAPVGSAALVTHDMSSRADLSPWLAGVYVLPTHRRSGIATALVRHATAFASGLGASRLYLYTNGAESLYKRLGWAPMRRERYEGRLVTIMSNELTA